MPEVVLHVDNGDDICEHINYSHGDGYEHIHHADSDGDFSEMILSADSYANTHSLISYANIHNLKSFAKDQLSSTRPSQRLSRRALT